MCKLCNNNIEPGIQELDISHCQEISHIPMIPGLIKIWCQGCPKLTEIPRIPGLRDIRCYKSSIIDISGFDDLEFLDCCDCPFLISISNNINLKSIYCVRSPNLRSISNVPKLDLISCSGCPSLASIPYDVVDKIMAKKYCYQCYGCGWLKYDPDYDFNIKKLVRLQRWFKRLYVSKRLTKLIPQIVPLYYHPDARGGFRDKKILMKFLNKCTLTDE